VALGYGKFKIFCVCRSWLGNYPGKHYWSGSGGEHSVRLLSLGKFCLYKTVNYKGNRKWNFVQNEERAGKFLASYILKIRHGAPMKKSWFVDRGSGKAWNTAVGKAEILPIARVTRLLWKRTPCHSKKIQNSTLLAVGSMRERKNPSIAEGSALDFISFCERWIESVPSLYILLFATSLKINLKQTVWGCGVWRSSVEYSWKFQWWFGINNNARISRKALQL